MIWHPRSHTLLGGEHGARTYQFLTHCTVLITKMLRKKMQVLSGLAGNRHIKELKAEIKYLYWILETGNGILFMNAFQILITAWCKLLTTNAFIIYAVFVIDVLMHLQFFTWIYMKMSEKAVLLLYSAFTYHLINLSLRFCFSQLLEKWSFVPVIYVLRKFVLLWLFCPFISMGPIQLQSDQIFLW